MDNSPPYGCRERLQERDFEFVVDVLGQDDNNASLKTLFRDKTALNVILDQDEILSAILQLRYPLSISPELYFYVLVRHALKQAGIEEMEVADYVAATLAECAHGDPTRVLSNDSNTGFTYHVDFLKALDQASAYEQFYLQVRCGNQFMVLTSLFPRFIRHRRDIHGAPGVRYYEGVARQAFESASRHPLAEEFALTGVYETLSQVFPQARRALNHLAQEYLFLDQ